MRKLFGILILLLVVWGGAGGVRAQEDAVVHAILFYSPSCGHCHVVITEVLPPLIETYGEQFNVVGINVTVSQGGALYQAAMEALDVPEEIRGGVPVMIVGTEVLFGSQQIPDRLPGLIESYLAEGGVGWPAIPGLEETLAAEAEATPETTAEATAESTAEATPEPEAEAPDGASGAIASVDEVAQPMSWRERFAQDVAGNSLSLLVLVGMVALALYRGAELRRAPQREPDAWRRFVPPLVLLGLIVAGYLAYVETQEVAAVCGPVGDCNSVQQSEYARLFGILPIAVLGLMGYVGIAAAWAVARYAQGRWSNLARLALVGMVWFGLLFSIYLTFLEPFVIGATCAWCLSSAVVMSALFLLITPLLHPALRALRRG